MASAMYALGVCVASCFAQIMVSSGTSAACHGNGMCIYAGDFINCMICLAALYFMFMK